MFKYNIKLIKTPLLMGNNFFNVTHLISSKEPLRDLLSPNIYITRNVIPPGVYTRRIDRNKVNPEGG